MNILLYDSGYGAIPFLKTAILKHKYHNYYLYLDQDVFPLGKKTPAFIRTHLLKLLTLFDEKGFDIVILACNTISSYLTYADLKTYRFKIFSIFAYNQQLFTDNCMFLGTKAAIARITEVPTKDCSQLPELIENHDVHALITEIKELDLKPESRVILGCTHFPLIKDIFNNIYPEVEFVDGHELLIDNIPEGEHLTLAGNEKGQKIITAYFLQFKS